MVMQLLSSLASTLILVAIAFFVFKALSGAKVKALPDLPAEGGRVSTAELKTFTKGKSEHFGFGNKQRLGFVELSPDRFRTGRFIIIDAEYAEIEAVRAKRFGLSTIVVFDFLDDRKSLAATVRRAQAPRLLNYLRSKSVPVQSADEPASSNPA